MFTFFHRKPKVVIDCFTTDNLVHQIVPITRAIKTVPDWWKKLPSESSVWKNREKNNMKLCQGFLELYKRGFVIEAWGDFNFNVIPDHTYEYDFSNGHIPQTHPRNQYGAAFKDHEHTKLISPWIFRSKRNHFFHFGPATWSLDKYEFIVLPGVVEYHCQNATNINIMIPIRKQEYSFIIPAGMPLVHIVPLNESYNYEIKNHLISHEEMQKIQIVPSKLHSSYQGIKKLMNRNEKRESEKCPFS